MVNLAHDWSFSSSTSLNSTIKHAFTRLSQQLHQRAIQVSIDIADEVLRSACPAAIQQAVEYLVEVAVERSPLHGEVYVAACTTSRGLEIEIADSGDELALPTLRAFNPQDCRPLLNFPVCGSGIRVFGSTCPQGGVAWTIVASQRMAHARAA